MRETGHALVRGAGATFDEPDPQLAREAMPAQLSLVEGLLRNDPKNAELQLLAAQGYCGYSFLFLEDSQPERAKALYLRGRDRALQALGEDGALKDLGAATMDRVPAILAKVDKDDAPALFWAAFAWAGYINLSKDSSEAIAQLPRVVAMMERVRQLDPDYHFAGADLFFGIYYASRPAILGGDVAKAKKHFEEARRRTSGKFLMTYALEAQYLAVAAQDQELFKGLLAKIQESPAGALPEARLEDEVAKQKAAKLLEKMIDLF